MNVTRLALVLLALGGLQWGPVLAAEPLTAEAKAKLDGYLPRVMNVTRFPALSVQVVSANETLYTANFVRDGFDFETSDDSVFFIGSVSKSITALGVVAATHDGVLSLDDPVAAYLPDLAGIETQGEGVLTVRHLLNQTSGYAETLGHDLPSRQADFRNIVPSRPAGSAYEYSSVNYILLGQVLERATGRSFSEWMDERVFDPLGMTSTVAEAPASATVSNAVPGFTYLYALAMPWNNDQLGAAAVPMGYMQSSPADLARYLQFYLRRSEDSVVPPQQITDMLRPPEGLDSRYGMGWFATTWDGEEAYYHAGMTAVSGTFILLLPESGLGFVVATNINSGAIAPATLEILRTVVDITLGNETEKYMPTEMLFHLAIGLGLIGGFLFLVGRFVRWFRNGRPMKLEWRGKPLLTLLIDFAMPLIIIAAVTIVFGITPMGMLEVLPDLGYALLLSIPLSWANGFLKAVNRAA